MAIRSVMTGRWAAAIGFAIAFALGVVAQRGGLIDQIGKYRSDIVFLTQQHMKLVAISGGLAIGVGVPLGMWLSRPRMRRVSETIMQRSHSLKYETMHLPRGWMVVGCALLSWALFIAAWQGIAATLGVFAG